MTLDQLYLRANSQERKLLTQAEAILQGPLPKMTPEDRVEMARAIVKAVEAWQSERDQAGN